MADVSLIASYWTVAGDTAPLKGISEISPHPLPDRIAAAANAGFEGFGLCHEDLMHSVERYGVGAIRSMLDDAGMRFVELEMLGDWCATGERREASDAVRADLLGVAEPLGACHLKCGGHPQGEHYPDEHLAAEFAALCDDCESVGLRVALEPMPFTAVPDPATALELVNLANRPNGGLCVDIWHVTRGGVPFDEVAKLPGELVVAVELDDATADQVGTAIEDTIDRRLLCGQGDFDIGGFIGAIESTGFRGPYGVEIISAEHRARPLAEAAQAAFETTVEQFDRRALPG